MEENDNDAKLTAPGDRGRDKRFGTVPHNFSNVENSFMLLESEKKRHVRGQKRRKQRYRIS